MGHFRSRKCLFCLKISTFGALGVSIWILNVLTLKAHPCMQKTASFEQPYVKIRCSHQKDYFLFISSISPFCREASPTRVCGFAQNTTQWFVCGMGTTTMGTEGDRSPQLFDPWDHQWVGPPNFGSIFHNIRRVIILFLGCLTWI